jgi:hypothetical protein
MVQGTGGQSKTISVARTRCCCADATDSRRFQVLSLILSGINGICAKLVIIHEQRALTRDGSGRGIAGGVSDSGGKPTMNHLHSTALLVALGMAAAGPAAAQQQLASAAPIGDPSRFQQADLNRDGVLTPEEFRAGFPEVDNPDEVFRALDTDGSGVITREQWVAEQRATDIEPAAGLDEPPVAEQWPGVRVHQLELEGTEDTLTVRYLTSGGRIGLEGTELGLGLLVSTDRDIIGSGRILAPDLLDRFLPPNITLRLGGKAMMALLDDPSDEVFSVGPGVEARVALPFLEATPVAGVGEVYYAPDILTFGEASRMFEFSGRVEVQFLESTVGFVGYRRLEFDRDGGDDTIVNNVMFGLRFAL